jgi:hypothetical protein
MAELEHALLSASGSHRWLGCPGSRKAERDFKDSSSPFAEEGTHAHALADECLKNGLDAEHFKGKKVLDKLVPNDMIDYVQDYLDYVRSLEHDNTHLYTEERVDFSNIVPEGFGTLDSGVLDYDTGIFHMIDLKYGKGLQVDAFENTQGLCYCSGVLNELEWLEVITGFRIHIVMPRKVTSEPWDVSVHELKEWGKYASERAELAMTNSAPRVPGEKQCQWCKAKADCKPLAAFVEETIAAEFDDLDDIDEETLKPSQKKTILDNKKLIINFVEAIELSVITLLEDGKSFPGYKMVEGRSNRRWTETAEVFLTDQLGEDAFNKKLIGVGDATKLLGEKPIAPFLEKPPGKPTLAPESDPRDAYTNTQVADEFDVVEDDDA